MFNTMYISRGYLILLSFFIVSVEFVKCEKSLPKLEISANHRFLVTTNGEPFFWLGDTGWLLFSKLNREEAEVYLEDRRSKGFNVIQAMVLHDIKHAVNVYGDSALINFKVNQPNTTYGNMAIDSVQYDFWDHVDYIINLAQQKGLYVALVPIWGSNIKGAKVTKKQAEQYASWLANRYKNATNVIWMNGGDTKGDKSTDIWNVIGNTIRQTSTEQLITFHPFGRMQSSTWFHNENWLDFNMFQSGHRSYEQDSTERCWGEDNWKYVAEDYARVPIKPTLDGEPSYEGIPQGLHDTTQPYWTAQDIRRYAYWSVFAGTCGFTYGHSAVMQFHKKNNPTPAYGVKEYWDIALNATGATQMKYLKQLILSKSYFDRVPAPELIVGKQGARYDYIAATKGKDYAFIYTCNGNSIKINLMRMNIETVKTSWYNPRTGEFTPIGTYKANEIRSFNPPGTKKVGNDWVLVLEKVTAR